MKLLACMSVAFCFALCGVTFAQGASAVRLVEDDLGTVAPTQATSLADLSLPDDVSPGERVTMTIRDVDLRDALQVFGEWTGRSIVVSAQIEGTIGLLQLVDERAENVLDAILENPEYDLAYNTTAKGVTYIYPANAERPAGAEPHTGSTGGIVPTGVDVIRGGVSSVSSAGPKALGPGLEALEGGGEPALPPAEKPMLFESIQLKYASATTVAELFGGRVIAAGGYGLGPEYANAQSQAVRNMSRMDAGYGNRNAVVGGGYGTQQFGGGGFGGGGNFGGGGFGGRGGGFGGGGNFGGGGFGGRGGGFGGGGMGGYGGGGMGGYGGGGFGGGGMGGMGGLPIPEDVQSVTGVVEHNAIIVYGAQEGIDQLRELIALLDRPPKQVAIEMIIADVSMSMAKSKYLRWAVTDGLFEVGLTPDGTQAGSLAVGFASGDLRAALYANEANSGIDVLAMPRVITMNNTMAMIAQQREVPIIVPQLTRDQFGNVMQGQTIEDSVSHGIMMTVTPRINEDNSVTMYVSPQVNLPGETWVVDGVPYPTEEERYIEALVTVPDGKTVVLGGLINKTKLISRGRIPILSDIPVLGSLFRTRSSSYTEKELLFFITVTVIPPTDIDVKL